MNEWPKNYYELRRVLGRKITERLAAEDGTKSRDDLLYDLRLYAGDLSVSSGVSLRTVYAIFAAKGVVLDREDAP